MPRTPTALLVCTLISSPALAQETSPEEPGIETKKSKGAAPAPAEAAAAGEAAEEAEAAAPARRAPQIGMAPDDTLVVPSYNLEDAGTSSAWKFDFHGFFRAPMRIGFGSRDDAGTGASKLQVHSPPVVPDTNYTRWTYTNVSPGPWVEMLFQYGNDRAKMTTAIAAYNITSGGWRELQAQLGIDRAFLTLNFPELLAERGRLAWNVGVFSNRYGAPGRYDAGAYETYVFGRTRIAGETLTLDLDIAPELQLIAEHGIGAKLDQQKWTPRAVGTPIPYEQFDPYPGPTQQGTTLLHHGHLGVVWGGMLTLTGHYLKAWTADARATGMNPDASMRVVGADLRLIGGWLGDGYVGFSSTKATNANALSDALELIHSQGGWQFTNNYLGGEGYGTVNTLAFQYTFSMAAFLLRPQAWWGDGADLTLQVFGMYNTIEGGEVNAAGEPITAVVQFRDIEGRKKFKWGAQALYSPLPFLSFGGRFDQVQPNLDDATRSFMVFTPRAILKTDFVTHEQVIIQYSIYSYRENVQLPFPFEGPGATFPANGQRDKGVFTIAASMWW